MGEGRRRLGARLIRPLPLLRTALVVISAADLLRGFVVVPLLLTGRATPFWMWNSAIVLVYGTVHAVGTWRTGDALRY